MHEQRRLRVARLGQGFDGAAEAEGGELEPEDLVGALEHGARLRESFDEVGAHADGLRTLTREEHCDAHGASSIRAG
jgi:hypothetical protein